MREASGLVEAEAAFVASQLAQSPAFASEANGKVQTERIADLLDLRCRCGYHATNLVGGGLMNGVSHLFTCSRCAEVVSALTWTVGIWEERAPGDVKATCPRCDGTKLEPWGQGSPPHGGCPRCGETVSSVSIGIAD